MRLCNIQRPRLIQKLSVYSSRQQQGRGKDVRHCVSWCKVPRTVQPHKEQADDFAEGKAVRYPDLAVSMTTCWITALRFDFNESLIFGRFDLFCRRVVKLMHMSSSYHAVPSESRPF